MVPFFLRLYKNFPEIKDQVTRLMPCHLSTTSTMLRSNIVCDAASRDPIGETAFADFDSQNIR